MLVSFLPLPPPSPLLARWAEQVTSLAASGCRPGWGARCHGCLVAIPPQVLPEAMLHKLCDLVVECGRRFSRRTSSKCPLMYQYYETQVTGGQGKPPYPRAVPGGGPRPHRHPTDPPLRARILQGYTSTSHTATTMVIYLPPTPIVSSSP